MGCGTAGNLREAPIVTAARTPVRAITPAPGDILDGSHNHDKYRRTTLLWDLVPREYRHTAGVLENRAAPSEKWSL